MGPLYCLRMDDTDCRWQQRMVTWRTFSAPWWGSTYWLWRRHAPQRSQSPFYPSRRDFLPQVLNLTLDRELRFWMSCTYFFLLGDRSCSCLQCHSGSLASLSNSDKFFSCTLRILRYQNISCNMFKFKGIKWLSSEQIKSWRSPEFLWSNFRHRICEIKNEN